MLVTFNNKNDIDIIVYIFGKQNIIAAGSSFCVETHQNEFSFAAEYVEFSYSAKESVETPRLKRKMFDFFNTKITEHINKCFVKIKSTYAVNAEGNCEIDLHLSVDYISYGKLGEWLLEVENTHYLFLRAESETADIKVLRAEPQNIKKYMTFYRNLHFFINSGVFSVVEWLFYLIAYLIIKINTREESFFKRLRTLYTMSRNDRESLLSMQLEDPLI